MPLRMIRTVEDVLTKVVLEKGKEVTAWASTSRSGAPTVHRVNHKGTEFQLVEGVEVVEFDNRDERRERERKEKGLDTDKVEFDVRLVKKLLVGDEVLERGHEAKVERVSHTEDGKRDYLVMLNNMALWLRGGRDCEVVLESARHPEKRPEHYGGW